MTAAIGHCASLTLVFLAALHAYWGLGGFWPGEDSRSLALTVAGFQGIRAMPPPLACFVVAGLLAFGAVWVQALSGAFASILPKWLVVLGGATIAAIFLGRGLAAYAPAWRSLTPEQPFASYDVALYGPLCLAIGSAIAVLTISRFLTK